MSLKKEPSYEEIAEDILVELGASRSISGFRYMAWAVKCVAEDSGKLRNIVKGLYVEGGIYFDVSGSSFERAIRQLLDVTIRNADKRTAKAYEIFGDNLDDICPSNKMAIAILAAEAKKRKRG